MVAAPSLRSPLRYPGGKAKIAAWIVSNLPDHDIYIEPYFGGGSVFFAKPPARIEVVNDLDHRVVNLFRVIREQPDELARLITLTPWARAEFLASDDVAGDPLEDARRFLVRVWMAHGGKLAYRTGWRNGWAGGKDASRGGPAKVWLTVPDRIAAVAQRLQEAIIDCRPAVDSLGQWAHPSCLVYADPPYVHDTRDRDGGGRGAIYRHEMNNDDHEALLDVLEAHPGPVVLSGYQTPLYDDRLTQWTRVDRQNYAYRGAERTESLWLNPVAAAALPRQNRQSGLFTDQVS